VDHGKKNRAGRGTEGNRKGGFILSSAREGVVAVDRFVKGNAKGSFYGGDTNF